MVDLTNYFVGPAEEDMKIKAQALLYATIGHGEYNVYNAKEVDFKGHIAAFGINTDFTMSLTITGDSTCTIVLNGIDQNATYSTSGEYLSIYIGSGPESGTIHIRKTHSGKGTLIDPEVKGGHVIWIGPS